MNDLPAFRDGEFLILTEIGGGINTTLINMLGGAQRLFLNLERHDGTLKRPSVFLT